jgi:type IV pilus assembly protein PilC
MEDAKGQGDSGWLKWLRQKNLRLPWNQPKANQQSVAISLQQYSLMLRSGVASAEALDILAQQSPDPVVRQAFEQIADDVIRRGHSLSNAMRKHPGIFNKTTVLLIRAAEESSNLAERLERAGLLIERQQRVQSQIRSALVSPLITTGACLTILFAIVKFVLPKFLDMYATMGMKLPVVSQFVISLVHLLNSPLFLLGLLVAGMLTYQNWPVLREKMFEKALAWPLTRNFVGSMLAIQFADILATTLKDGIPIQRAMDLLRDTSPYKLHATQMDLVGERIRNSGSLSEALEDVYYFPKMISAMLCVGEESGHLDELLDAARSLLEEQNAQLSSQIVAMIEPMAIAGMGVSMGVICVGMFLPIYGMLSQLG